MPPKITPIKKVDKNILLGNKFKNIWPEYSKRIIFQNKWKKPEWKKLYEIIDQGLNIKFFKSDERSNQEMIEIFE